MKIEEAIKRYSINAEYERTHGNLQGCLEFRQLADWLKELKQLREQTRWISVSERLPEDLEPVNITWVNHEPEPYYHDIKDKNYVATGIHYKGQWYWYSTTCADYLGEYGSNEVDKVDDAIEIVAWMQLPTPYQSEIPTGAEGSEQE